MNIEQIELDYLTEEDYIPLQKVMELSYEGMPDLRWSREEIRKLITIFPEALTP